MAEVMKAAESGCLIVSNFWPYQKLYETAKLYADGKATYSEMMAASRLCEESVGTAEDNPDCGDGFHYDTHPMVERGLCQNFVAVWAVTNRETRVGHV